MTDPRALAAAFAFFRSRGFQHGDAATHADVLLGWAEQVWGWAGALQAERDQAVDAAAAADRRVEHITAVVRRAVDAADPDRPGALADVVHTIARLLDQPDPVQAVPAGCACACTSQGEAKPAETTPNVGLDTEATS